jgi:hypothetical protein
MERYNVNSNTSGCFALERMVSFMYWSPELTCPTKAKKRCKTCRLASESAVAACPIPGFVNAMALWFVVLAEVVDRGR